MTRGNRVDRIDRVDSGLWDLGGLQQVVVDV